MKRPNPLFFVLCLTYSLASCSQESVKQESHSSSGNVDDLFIDYEDFLKSLTPVWAVSMGFDEYDGKWADNSLSSIENRTQTLEDFQIQLEEVDAQSLDKEDRIYLNLLDYDITDRLNAIRGNQHYFSITEQYGIHHDIPSAIANHSTKNDEQIDNLLLMMRSIPEQIDSSISVLKEGIRLGLVPSRSAVKGVVQQIKILRETRYEENPFMKPFNKMWSSNSYLDEDQMEKLAHTPEIIIRKDILPAFKKLEDFVKDEYLPACRESFGVSEVAGGEKMYDHLIKHFTTTSMTAKEIFELGNSEVSRIRSEMEKVKDELSFVGTLNEFNNHLRTDAKFFHTNKEELLSAYRDICKRIDPGLASLFGKLPRLSYGVIPVPAYLEENYTTARYQSGSSSEGRAGNFLANTFDLNSRPIWEMEALSLHEAVPGHHLQISLEQELENVPGFKKFIYYTVFVEGWALYGESLGQDLGMYQDLYSKYGQLTYEMWRAIRLVLDPGIHAFGWTRQEAMDFFLENSAKTEKDVQVEVDRYIGWPGQALAYKIGELKIKELREKVETKEGANFDVREFHDLILSRGSVPLELLEDMVEERYGI